MTSQTQLDELERALSYEKLRDRINPDQVRDFVDNIDVTAVVVPFLVHAIMTPISEDVKRARRVPTRGGCRGRRQIAWIQAKVIIRKTQDDDWLISYVCFYCKLGAFDLDH